MKTLKLILLSTLLLGSGFSAAQVVLTKTYESTVNMVRLPRVDGGTIAVRECEDCDYVTLRTSVNTLWTIDNRRLKLDEFRARIEQFRQSGDQSVNVTREVQSDVVIEVFLYTE